jgi:Methyltransferase FkbM domain
VPATTLRQVMVDLDVGNFDLVCDIEGAELDLIRNDADILSRCRLAIVEIHPDVFADKGASEQEFIALLVRAGLEIVDRDANVLVARNPAFAASTE